MTKPTPATTTFRDLNIAEPAEPLITALDKIGYETPSPIQAEAIPHLLQGLDLLGHAPTGTGKTAAFALPLLSRLDMHDKNVQVMTLTPTRELAIQVAHSSAMHHISKAFMYCRSTAVRNIPGRSGS
jgi:ATP-dependent RNA helicase DeaD